MAGSFHQSLPLGTVTGHISQERSLYVLTETALMNCCLLWERSESQLLCTFFALIPQFWCLALFPCHAHSLHLAFLWTLPSECMGFKAVYCISFLRLKLWKYWKENGWKLFMTSSQFFYNCLRQAGCCVFAGPERDDLQLFASSFIWYWNEHSFASIF